MYWFSHYRLFVTFRNCCFTQAWILQIILSEVLGVPSTMETGVRNKTINFYDPEGRFDYGVAYDYNGLSKATEIKDCRTLGQPTSDKDAYQSCGHILLEIWSGQQDILDGLVEADMVETEQFLGIIGEEGWLIPKYTAEKDSSLLSYFGMTGEKNRRRLAERFLRPTTWKEYCMEVVSDGCETSSDNSTETDQSPAAVRPPETPEEEEMFFAQGLYTGHFRKTEENNCDRWPTNCTGHFIDYPCGWTSFFIQQAHHLEIALKSSGKEPYSEGYSYARAVQIWAAANWTKSDVIGWWWSQMLFPRL